MLFLIEIRGEQTGESPHPSSCPPPLLRFSVQPPAELPELSAPFPPPRPPQTVCSLWREGAKAPVIGARPSQCLIGFETSATAVSIAHWIILNLSRARLLFPVGDGRMRCGKRQLGPRRRVATQRGDAGRCGLGTREWNPGRPASSAAYWGAAPRGFSASFPAGLWMTSMGLCGLLRTKSICIHPIWTR